jgi:hypothetical protein
MRSTAHFLLAASCSLVLTHAASGQTKDPLSGTWTGYIGRSEATPTPATLAVKQTADGKLVGTLTGPKLMPGDIKSGSFNAATGGLKLTILVRPTSDDAGGEVFFDGRVANDSAIGAMVLGGEKGVFKFARQSKEDIVVKHVAPQDAGVTAAKRGFVEVSGWIAAAAELVPADKYSYRPASTVRTYGQLVAHIVDGFRYYCERAAGKNVQWSDATEKGATTKAALAPALKKAIADCGAPYASGQVAPLMENVGHSNLHYGNMITYIRMLGMTPPSS